jgi:methylaspartate ammonia-lyase
VGFPSSSAPWSQPMSDLDRPSYEVGYREGESNRQADWDLALSDYCDLPENVDIDPFAIAAYIQRLQKQVEEERERVLAEVDERLRQASDDTWAAIRDLVEEAESW